MKTTRLRCLGSLWRRAPIALAACLVGSVALGRPSPASGQEKADELPGRIFASGYRDAGVLSGIFAIDPRSETWTRISGERSAAARVSPDGRRLAFFRLKRAVNEFESFIEEIEGDRPPTRIFEGLGGPTCWLPDGKALLFWVDEDPADRSKGSTFRVSDDGSRREKLPLPETERVIDCSSDGRWLLSYSIRRPPADGPMSDPVQHLYLMRPDGKDERCLFEGTHEQRDDPRNFHHVRALWGRFAPDGRRISYTRSEVKQADGKRTVDSSLWTVGTDGKDRRLVLKREGDDTPGMAVWSPDGKWLAVTIVTLDPDGRGGTTRIEVMDPEGGHRRPIHLPEASTLFLLDWR